MGAVKRLIQINSGAAVLASVAPAAQSAKTKTQAHIVIWGGGHGGQPPKAGAG
jgi:hypothetical protein